VRQRQDSAPEFQARLEEMLERTLDVLGGAGWGYALNLRKGQEAVESLPNQMRFA